LHLGEGRIAPTIAIKYFVNPLFHETFHYNHGNGVYTDEEIDGLKQYHDTWLTEHNIRDQYAGLVEQFGDGLREGAEEDYRGGGVFAEGAAAAFADYGQSRFDISGRTAD